MVQLVDADIRTREVLGWTGLHLCHYQGSSCSQKIRAILSLKSASWESHPVDLMRNENYSEWYMGINPRGLVPTWARERSGRASPSRK
jgi:ganglioside-induced differentiation-associated protein 1